MSPTVRSFFPLRAVLAAATLAFACAAPARAERADRDKPVNLEAARITVDDAKKVHVFEGNVSLAQGTLLLLADKVVVSQDADGFQKGIAYGNPARFRQKREGRDEYIEGEAERIEYDARSERAEFFGKAKVKSAGDEVKGAYIGYDAVTERYLATATANGADGKPVRGDGRVRAVIQPKGNKGGATAPAAPTAPDPVPLKSAKELQGQ